MHWIWPRIEVVFGTLELNIPFPQFGIAETADEAAALADTLDFPLLIRPSYVLGGQGMKIVINKQELEEHVINCENDSRK
jgi:carbamoyl-phosphate synthase large subunit